LSNGPLLGNKAAVVVDGTLDQPGDRDKGWTVEGRTPWTPSPSASGKPARRLVALRNLPRLRSQGNRSRF
jgi:hypothetical protein